jgi:hypothetical protein
MLGNYGKKNPWPESASELYRPSDRRLSAKLVQTFAERGCHVVSVMDPYGRILGFLSPGKGVLKVVLETQSRNFMDKDCIVFSTLVTCGHRK